MHIVIIDDEKILSRGIAKKIRHDHYHVSVINSYGEFLSADIKNVDLYIIDLSLGDGSGLDIISSLKQDDTTQDIPILVMSGHDDVATKVEGLDTGADDYIVKPFDPKELLARVRSLLRRKNTPVNKAILHYKDFSYDTTKREMSYKGKTIALTKKERQILEVLLSQQDSFIKKNHFIEKLWAKNSNYVTDNTVNVTICNLRKKLGKNFKLETRIGEGYILQN